MTPHHQQRRRGDPPQAGWRLWLWRAERVWQDVVPAIAVLAAAYAVFGYNDEAEERRDQTCVAFERDAQAAVAAYEEAVRLYERSVEFLQTAPADQAYLRDLARENLPRLRSDVMLRHEQAKVSAAPPYCDEENVGLEEPNPTLPDEPLP